MNHNRTVFSTLLVLAFGLLFQGCMTKTVQVGAVLPLSGDDAGYGEEIRRGLELAYEELAEGQGGVAPFALEIVDSASDPQRARELTRTSYEAGAQVVIGGVTSDEAAVMIEEVDEFNRILLSPSASAPELSGSSPNFYRITPSAYTEAVKMAHFARKTLKETTAVVVYEDRKFSRGIESVFSPAFEDAGGQVAAAVEIPCALSEPGEWREQVREHRPDLVYVVGYEAKVAQVIGGLKDDGYKGRILTSRAFARRSAVERLGEDAVGVMLTHSVPALDSEAERSKRFVRAYRARWGEAPGIYAAYGYDAVHVLATAVAGRPAMASEVREGLRFAVREFPGVTGTIQFNDKGDVSKYPRVYIVGEDLALHEYESWMEARKQAIRDKLHDLRSKATSVTGAGPVSPSAL